jgi:hypothetical protein
LTQIPPESEFARTSFAPSAEQAALCQNPLKLVEVQVAPASVDDQTLSDSAAISLFPSADDATVRTRLMGALFVLQVAPESVDVRKLCVPEMVTEATSFVPSAELATANQPTEGMLLETQNAPAFVVVKYDTLETAIIRLPSAELATDFQTSFATLFETHVAPKSGEV